MSKSGIGNDMAATPDYAAQLRAAMDAQDLDNPTMPHTSSHDDEEVARLLREQLALFDKSADTPLPVETDLAGNEDVSEDGELEAIKGFLAELEQSAEESSQEATDTPLVLPTTPCQVEKVDRLYQPGEEMEEEVILPEEDVDEAMDAPEDEIQEEIDLPEEEIQEEEELPEEDIQEEEEFPEEEIQEEVDLPEEEIQEEEEIPKEEIQEEVDLPEEEIEEEILEDTVAQDADIEETVQDTAIEEDIHDTAMPEEVLDTRPTQRMVVVEEPVEETNIQEAVQEVLTQIGFEDSMIQGATLVSDDVIESYLQEIETWERGQDQPVDVARPETHATDIVTDDDINGHPLAEAWQGAILARLDEDTKASLRRLGMLEEEEAVQLDMFMADTQVEPPEQTQEAPVEEVDTPATDRPVVVDITTETVWQDPLQLTLDEYQKTRRYPHTPPVVQSEPVSAQPVAQPASQYATVDEQQSYQNDTEMYVNLGYEQDINRTQDPATVGEVSQASAREDTYLGGETDTRNTESVAYRGEEYTSSTQNCTIERNYQKAGIRARFNLWWTLAATLFGLFYDTLPHWADLLGAPVQLYVNVRAYPAYGILLLWLGILPSITKLCRGIRSLWEFKPVTYAMPAVAVVLVWIETIVACLLPGQGVHLYVGGALLFVFFACLGDCFKVASEEVSFHVVSSGKSVYLLAKEPISAAEDKREDEDDDAYMATWRVRKVSKLSDYFMWVTRYHREESLVGVLLPMAFLGTLAVTCGIFVTGAIRGDADFWINGISAFVGVFLMILPAAFIINMTLPLLRANRIIGRHGSTVLSADVAREYALDENAWGDPTPDAVKLSFMAVDVLGAGNIKEITVKGDEHTATYRQMARRLFALLGSPLAGEDNKLRPRDLKGIHLEIAEVDEHCLRLYMVDTPRETACEILMGTHEALLRRGIRLPREHMEQKYKKTGDSRVIYLAFDRKFRLAYAAKYMPRRSFANALPVLEQLGHNLSVVSFDPLVTPDVLATACTPEVPHIGLSRPDHMVEEQDSRSCGLMATGRAVDITYPLLACRRIKKAEILGRLVACGSMALGLLLTAILLWTGALVHINTLMLCAWQFAWIGVMTLVNVIYINATKLTITAIPTKPKK